MSIYLDEKNPSKHKPFDDASADIVEYVRYLEVIAGKSANTAFSYYCDLRGFSRFMKRRRGLVAENAELKEIDPKGLDTAFWGSVTKEDVYEYLYFLNRECGNKKSSTARRLASCMGFMTIWSIRSTAFRRTRRLPSNRPSRIKFCPNI